MRSFTPERAMFIDTETTGLAMGAGTYAFLIGLGTLRGGRFVVRQFFMRDFSEESAQLYLLSNTLKDGDYLVSFNGKSYDVPLLENRFVMSRMGMDIGCMPHFDLLYTARRLWKHRLADCRLATVEREMLGVQRGDDIPGEQIPEVFFNYLRGRDRGEIARVFHHNLFDIISLATLCGAIRSMTAEPLAVEPKDGGEMFALGSLWEDAGMEEEGRYCYEKALDLEMPWNHRLLTMARLSLIHKRRGRWAEALNLWERMKAENPEDIFPYQELAKYYEHRAGDFDRALRLVEEALEKVCSSDGQYWGAADSMAAMLEHRRNRLKRRAGMREER